jgi:hypothetical protein
MSSTNGQSKSTVAVPAVSIPSTNAAVVPSAHDQLMAELAALKAENLKLKAVSSNGLSLRVSEKGALSVYGIGRFPVTLYKGQWAKVIANIEAIKTFLSANDSMLAEKAKTEPDATSKE